MTIAETIKERNPEATVERNLRIKRPQRKVALPTLEGIYFEKVKGLSSHNILKTIFQQNMFIMTCSIRYRY